MGHTKLRPTSESAFCRDPTSGWVTSGVQAQDRGGRGESSILAGVLDTCRSCEGLIWYSRPTYRHGIPSVRTAWSSQVKASSTHITLDRCTAFAEANEHQSSFPQGWPICSACLPPTPQQFGTTGTTHPSSRSSSSRSSGSILL